MGRASSGHWALERHDYGALPVASNRSASSTSDRRCAEGAARSMGAFLFCQGVGLRSTEPCNVSLKFAFGCSVINEGHALLA